MGVRGASLGSFRDNGHKAGTISGHVARPDPGVPQVASFGLRYHRSGTGRPHSKERERAQPVVGTDA